MKRLTGEGVIKFIAQNGIELEYDVRIHKPKRSDEANRYFHRLVGLLAKGNQEAFYLKKNELILQYGNRELMRNPDGSLKHRLLPDNDRWKYDPVDHYQPTSYTDVFRGVPHRAFVYLKGTHTYNSKEMYDLIEGTRNECLGCDIPWEEVATPREIYLMEQLKGNSYGRNAKDKEDGVND